MSERTSEDYEIQITNLSEMCANTARYLREAHALNSDLLEALEALMGTVVEPMCYHPDAPGYQEARAKSLAALKKAKL